MPAYRWPIPLILLGLMLTSCTAQPPQVGQSQSPTSADTPTADPNQETPEPLSTALARSAPPEQDPFPLAGPGPYQPGNRAHTYTDQNRAGREVRITIWYPAQKTSGAEDQPGIQTALPDLSGAPYPVILTGKNTGDYLFKSHLASRGFVMVIVRTPNFQYEDDWGLNVLDGPLDFLFVLNQLASSPPEGLEGLFDTDNVGVAGYSWDGFFSLALSGVRIDPQHYLSLCAEVSNLEPPLSPSLVAYYCSLAAEWDQLASLAGPEITRSTDGLWQPVQDERIRAVMPMAPDGIWLYGERGLAAAKTPALFISGTEDEFYPRETCPIFQHYGSQDKTLISFIHQNHMMVFNPIQAQQMKHFAAAFFGYYLQGAEELLPLFGEEFISTKTDLAWGIYSK